MGHCPSPAPWVQCPGELLSFPWHLDLHLVRETESCGSLQEGRKDLLVRGGEASKASPVHLLCLPGRCPSAGCNQDSLPHSRAAGTLLRHLSQVPADLSTPAPPDPLASSEKCPRQWGSPTDTYVFHFELGTPPSRDRLLGAALDGQHLCAERVSFQGPARVSWDLCARSLASCCWWPYCRPFTISRGCDGAGPRPPQKPLHATSSPS